MTDGSERALLENTLDRNRIALINTALGLPEDDARRRLVPSMTTPIALVKHAAFAERLWFQHQLAGLRQSECDGNATDSEGSWVVTPDETLADLVADFRRACDRSREIAAQYDLDHTITHDHVGTVSLRWIYLHMIEELARHAGHGDILREQITAAERRTAPSTEATHPAP